MRFNFKLLLSTLVFLSACQTRLSFEGRRYTKGVYWNITHSKKFKKNTTDKQQAQELELVKSINQQASCQKLPLRIQTIENTLILNIKTQEPLNVKQRYIRKAPSYVNANTHSKAHKKLNSERKLKSVLSDGKGLMILIFFLKVLKWIFLIASPFYLLGGILIGAFFDPYIGLFVIVMSLLGLLISYGLHKLIKKLKNNFKTNYTPKNKIIITGYRVIEVFSLLGAFSFLLPIIINYINYINWFITLPVNLKFSPLLTPSKGIEPFLIVFLGLALLAAWLDTSKYNFSDPKHQKRQRIKTFIVSGLLFLTGLLYLLIGLANVFSFIGLSFYAPVQHPKGSAYLIVCGLISIATALMPSKLLFGKNLITELKSKFK